MRARQSHDLTGAGELRRGINVTSHRVGMLLAGTWLRGTDSSGPSSAHQKTERRAMGAATGETFVTLCIAICQFTKEAAPNQSVASL